MAVAYQNGVSSEEVIEINVRSILRQKLPLRLLAM